jgi:predicted hotdog family 3-hydroxylacyl-ACP dehydratase
MKKNVPTNIPELPLPAELLLPHRSAMLFVESLVRRWDESSTAKAVLPKSGICLSEGKLLPEFFIELVAQATAMANGYDALCAGVSRKNGMLVGVDTFSFPGKVEMGSTVRIETEKTFEFGAVKIIHGEVWDADELLAAGDIKVWEEPD